MGRWSVGMSVIQRLPASSMSTTSSAGEEAHDAVAHALSSEPATAPLASATTQPQQVHKAASTKQPQKKKDGKTTTTLSKKKRRPVKLAPRFSRDAAVASCNTDPRAAEMNGENVRLLRELFTTSTCRCFIIKSFSDANLHKSLKYGVWSSTYTTNMLLDQVFQSDFSAVRPVLLFFSVCGTKHFSGIARMTSRVRPDLAFQLWEKLKYEGVFHVEWLLVKDVPNFVLTDIKMSNTPTKKSITSCRDGEEVLYEEASRFIEVFSSFPSRSSAWDDYDHFERLQPALESKRALGDDARETTQLHAHDVDIDDALARWLRRVPYS
ncbi:hypothetical protein PINS_up004980 [Pythium insidiosum]|nr:hypothetical protein PINS_up004980 [Pythium insidiosum]